jgi:hypothetical protein
MNSKLPTPKRGAFPTPKDVRDKAPPYIPDDGPADDRQDDAHGSPDSPQLQDDQTDSKDKDSKQK